MCAAEVVVGEVQAVGAPQVVPLLAEGVVLEGLHAGFIDWHTSMLKQGETKSKR